MFSQLFKKFLKVVWFLPGFLLWAAFPPMGERMDVLFALAPLLWLGRREVSAGLVAKRCFQSGLVYWIATLSWMPAIVKNGGPWPLVVLGWFALAAYCALFFWLFGWLSATYWRWARGGLDSEDQRIRGRYGLRLLGVLVVEPVLWCGLELVRSRLFGGFAWNQLGVVPVNSGFGAPAALGGVYLCSAVVILINGTVAGIVERMWKPERSGFANLKRLGMLETLLAFVLVFGIYKAASVARDVRHDTGDETGFLKVAMIQRNFPCVFQTQEENPLEVYEDLLGNVAMLRPDLVVLSESAMCEFGPVDSPRARSFAAWIAKKTEGAALLAGGSRNADAKAYNSAALYSSGLQPSIYDKVHLVPFGEFIPGDKLIPALQKLAPVGSCTPGDLKTIDLDVRRGTGDGKARAGVAICFEDTDSAQMRALAKKGARVLFFITNDSWFSHSVEAEQHSWQAVARAVETGLPVVRVGNSGVTGTITPEGRTTWLLGPDARPLVDRKGTMFDKVELNAGEAPTPYVRYGDIPLLVVFSLLLLPYICALTRSMRGKFLVKYANRYE